MPSKFLAGDILHRYSDDERGQAKLAAERRRLRADGALAASLALATGWRTTAREHFERELVEFMEVARSWPLGELARTFVDGDSKRFLDTLERRVDPLISLVDHATKHAALCAGISLPPDESVNDQVPRLNSALQDIPQLVVPLLRLIYVAGQRAQRFPFKHRVRGFVVEDGNAHVVTIGVGHAAVKRIGVLPDGARLITEAVSRGWGDRGDEKLPDAVLLDHHVEGQTIGGDSLALGVVVAAAAARGRYDARGVVATGGADDNPFGPLREGLEQKLISLMEFNELRGTPLTRLLIAERERHVATIAGVHVHRVGERGRVIDILAQPTSFEVHSLSSAETPFHSTTIPVDRLEREINAHFERSGRIGVVVVGETGAGKTTLCRALTARWNASPGPRRRAAVFWRRAHPLVTAAELATELGGTPFNHEPLDGRLSIIADLIENRQLHELVWLIAGIASSSEPAELIKALATVEQQRRERGTPTVAMTLPLRVVLCLRPGQYARVRALLDVLDWPVIPSLELQDDELDALNTPPHMRGICRLGFAWKEPARALDPSASPEALMNSLAADRLDELERACPGTSVAIDAAIARIAASASTRIELPPSMMDLLEAGGLGRREREVLQVDGDWYLEYRLAECLRDHDAARDAESASRWLGVIAGDEPFDDVLHGALALALMRRWELRFRKRLSQFVKDGTPETVPVAVRAIVELGRYFPTRYPKRWKRLARGLRKQSSAHWLAALGAVSAQADAGFLIAESLRHTDADVRTVARMTLQRSIREVVRADTTPAHLLEIVELQAQTLWVLVPRTNRFWWLRRVTMPRLPIVSVIESCLVIATEAARAGSEEAYAECARRLGGVIRSLVQRSWRMWIVSKILRPGATIQSWIKQTRSHNPFHHGKDFRAFFSLPRAKRERLAAIVEVIRAGADREDRAAYFADVARITATVQRSDLAYAATNTVVEAAWCLRPDDIDTVLTQVVGLLRDRYRDMVAKPETWPFAQSCLFSMFRALWSVPPDRAAAHVDEFNALVLHWHRETKGGVFQTAGNAEMRIQYLFRAEALSLRVRLPVGTAFLACIGAKYTSPETQLDEIGHLAEECHEWKAARSLLHTLLGTLSEDGRRQLARPIKKQIGRIAKHSPREAASWSRMVDLAADTFQNPISNERAMVGVSLAFEDAVYALLARDRGFRRMYADWLSGSYTRSSLSDWFVLAFEILKDAIATPPLSVSPG